MCHVIVKQSHRFKNMPQLQKQFVHNCHLSRSHFTVTWSHVSFIKNDIYSSMCKQHSGALSHSNEFPVVAARVWCHSEYIHRLLGTYLTNTADTNIQFLGWMIESNFICGFLTAWNCPSVSEFMPRNINDFRQSFMCWPVGISRSHVDGLVQERHNSIANAMELHLSCTNPSMCGAYPGKSSHLNQPCPPVVVAINLP